MRQGLHAISSKNFKTFAALNIARILRSTVKLLESNEEEAREPAKSKKPPLHGEKRFGHHPLAATLPSSSRINTTDVQELREKKPRTAKKKDKANRTEVARILRCATELLKTLEAARKKRQDVDTAKASEEKDVESEAQAKDKDKANRTKVARILRCGADLLESLEAASKKR